MRKFFVTVFAIFATTTAWSAPQFTITCDAGANNGCILKGQFSNLVIKNCADMKNIQLKKDTPIIIDTDSAGSTCHHEIKKQRNSSHTDCQASDIQSRYFTSNNTNYFIVFCSDDYLETLGTTYDNINDSDWTYAKKKCVGSGGEWDENNTTTPCSCPNSDTTLTDGECLCNIGITKYLVGGNCTVTGGACTSTGGEPYDKSETDTDYCRCPDTMTTITIREDSKVEACACRPGYQYRDPMRRWEGCVETNNNVTISGTIYNHDDQTKTISGINLVVLSTSKATTTDTNGSFILNEVPNTAYVAISGIGFKEQIWPATKLINATIKLVPSTITFDKGDIETESDCTKSGGTPNNNKCDCDINKNLIHNDEETKCICAGGFTRQKETDECKPVDSQNPENMQNQAENNTKTGANSEELSEKLKSAKDALAVAKEKENSWANRGLSAASTAMTGLGGMQLAEGIAERKANAEAETQMRNYISTMKCEYGNGQGAVFSNEEITLPGGNELLEYYTEYKTLADNLKTTKAALGLRAGIESETLYDRAQSGLYQYANLGKTGGGETSLYRALTDTESTDAVAWSEQKETASKKLNAGTAATVVGVGGGIIGNYFINERDTKDDKKD